MSRIQTNERIKPLVDSLLTQHIELRLTQITAPFEKGNGYAWWTMPPGVRSFTATEYGGFETSASLVVDTFARSNFDFRTARVATIANAPVCWLYTEWSSNAKPF